MVGNVLYYFLCILGAVGVGEAILVRNYIMLRICIINGTRSGTLRNMTLQEVERRRTNGDQMSIAVSECFCSVLLKHETIRRHEILNTFSFVGHRPQAGSGRSPGGLPRGRSVTDIPLVP